MCSCIADRQVRCLICSLRWGGRDSLVWSIRVWSCFSSYETTPSCSFKPNVKVCSRKFMRFEISIRFRMKVLAVLTPTGNSLQKTKATTKLHTLLCVTFAKRRFLFSFFLAVSRYLNSFLHLNPIIWSQKYFSTWLHVSHCTKI